MYVCFVVFSTDAIVDVIFVHFITIIIFCSDICLPIKILLNFNLGMTSGRVSYQRCLLSLVFSLTHLIFQIEPNQILAALYEHVPKAGPILKKLVSYQKKGPWRGVWVLGVCPEIFVMSGVDLGMRLSVSGWSWVSSVGSPILSVGVGRH